MGTIRAASAIRQGEVARIGLNLNRLGREPYLAVGIMADRECFGLIERENRLVGRGRVSARPGWAGEKDAPTPAGADGLFEVAPRTHEKEHGDRKQEIHPRRQ